jgi:sulfide:quinone oxidoreductase
MTDRDKQRVLIAGGGVAALEAALALRALADEHVTIDLLTPELHFYYRPLSVAEPFELGEARRFELDTLSRAIGVDLIPGALVAVDAPAHVVRTSKSAEIPYDLLLVATGATPTPAIPGAITFRGPADIETIRELLGELESGEAQSVVFAIPWGAVWSLPAYELALLTAGHLEHHGTEGVELTVVTPEDEPLRLFGAPASNALRELLESRGIAIRTGACATSFAGGELELVPEGRIAADRVVALPRLRGTPIDGLPQTVDGFIPVDGHCRIHGFDDVFAAGDITSFTIKQGGIATQQAEAAAEAIAAAAGASLEPEGFRPVLRGLLLTGREPRYLRRELGSHPVREPLAAAEPLWWPPAKIVGRYLAPFLASFAGDEAPLEVTPVAPGTIEVEVELDPDAVGGLATSPLGIVAETAANGERVGAFMAPDPLIVAPEDTLGEVAELLLRGSETAAAVAEYGHIIGILTTDDLLRADAARVHPSEARVRQWMTVEPVTIAPDSSVSAAARLMREFGVHHLPVVEENRPVGMLGLDEVAEHADVLVGVDAES